MSKSKKRKHNEIQNLLPYELQGPSKVQKKSDEQDININTNSGFLSAHNIYLHPASLSKNRKNLFQNQILSNGGNVISDLSSSINVKTLLILIDDNLIDKKRISQMIEKIENLKSSEGKW